MWTCPRCDRRFGAANRPHVCAPAMAVDAWFAGRDPLDRAIYDAVAGVIAAELPDGEVEIEALGVGVMFKRARTFAELRPRRHGLALSLVLDEPLVSTRVTRTLRMQRTTRAGYVVPLTSPGDVDDELAAWIVRSFEDAAPRRR